MTTTLGIEPNGLVLSKTLSRSVLFEIVGQKGEFYRLTASGYEAADLLEDFARWSTSQVTVEARYMNAPADSLTLPCSGIVQLPATYYQVRVRADVM